MDHGAEEGVVAAVAAGDEGSKGIVPGWQASEQKLDAICQRWALSDGLKVVPDPRTSSPKKGCRLRKLEARPTQELLGYIHLATVTR